MKITLLPTVALPDVTADVLPTIQGSVIFYQGQVYDFSPLTPGNEIEVGKPFVGPVMNIGGVIHATLIYQFDAKNALPIQSTNPSDYIFDVIEGVVPDPIQYFPAAQPEVMYVD